MKYPAISIRQPWAGAILYACASFTLMVHAAEPQMPPHAL